MAGLSADCRCAVAGFASLIQEDIVEVASKTLLVRTSFALLSIFSSMSCATSEGGRVFPCIFWVTFQCEASFFMAQNGEAADLQAAKAIVDGHHGSGMPSGGRSSNDRGSTAFKPIL